MRTFIETSIAVPAISPSPIAAWPSPRNSRAPGTFTGRYSVLPALASSVHVAAEFRRDDGTPHLPGRGRDPHAAQERMQRNLHREVRIVSAEGRHVGRLVNRVEPFFLGNPGSQHGSVVAAVQCAEARPCVAVAYFALDIERLKLYYHYQCVPGLGSLHVERPGQRIGTI